MSGRAPRWIAIALAAAALPASPASACRLPDAHTAYIHSALPSPLPEGLIVAEVEFEPVASRYRDGDRARVVRMIQGDPGPRHLIGRQAWETTCSLPFANGRTGYVIAIPRGTSSGLPVVHFVEVSRFSGFRLPDGWQLPPGEAERIALPPGRGTVER